MQVKKAAEAVALKKIRAVPKLGLGVSRARTEPAALVGASVRGLWGTPGRQHPPNALREELDATRRCRHMHRNVWRRV